MDVREFQSFFDQSQDLIGVLDADLHYVAVNSTLCEYWGYPREEIVGNSVRNIAGEALFKGLLQTHLLKCLAGESVEYEAWVTFPKMGRRFVDVRYTPRFDQAGGVNGVFIICRDKTASKQLEKRTEQERDNLKKILSTVDIGLVLFNKDMTVDWLNNKLLKSFHGAKTHMPCHHIFGQSSCFCGTCPTRSTFETGEVQYKELFLEGEDKWYTLTTVPLTDHKGYFDQVLGRIEDITTRKQAENAIRESEQRFREIFESVDMIAVQGYDEDRRVVYWNPASEHLYGYSTEEAMGELLENLIIPVPMHEAVIAAHKAWVHQDIPIPAGELVLRRKDGGPVPVHSSHVMQKTTAGKKVMYCVDVDLAEIKRIHNQLVRAKEEAEAANEAKSEFLANMSHEIRTPLNGIQGMLSLMQGTNLDEIQREYAQAGADSAKRLNHLLSDILDISRVEAGKLVIEEGAFSITELVRKVEDLYRLAFQDSCVSFVCNVDEDVPEMLVGDNARLQQVLINLVGNGLKYTDSGAVSLRVSKLVANDGEQRIMFSVKDTGRGITAEKLDALFEPFVQGSKGYARRYQGAGLGLAICKRLVGLMGGVMSVESEVGAGSVFHVVVPLQNVSEANEQAPVLVTRSCGVFFGTRVLLAEDDRINRMVGKRLLEKIGCDVDVARHGREAVSMVGANEYDIVLIDVQMPEMDGVEATKAIRSGAAGEDKKDIPIVALTAFTMVGDREKFLAHGMSDYIPKPVETEDILRVLNIFSEGRADD